MSDIYAEYVTLLCHMDGTNGSTTIVDERGHTITAVGNAQISTAQSKFGGASYLGDGTGDVATLAHSSDFAFGSGDFTIEAWVRPANNTQVADVVSKRLNYGPWLLYQSGASFYGYISSTGSTWDLLGAAIGSVTANTWTHLALSRNSTTIKGYTNGVLGVTGTISAAASLYADSNGVGIGGLTDGTSSWDGYIDEVRLTKGIGRYPFAFTPPAAPYDLNQEPTLYDVPAIGMHSSARNLGAASSSGVVQGTVTELGTPVSRVVRVYRSDNGRLLASTTSNLLGKFSARWKGYTGTVDVVAYDDAAGTSYSSIIKATVTPA